MEQVVSLLNELVTVPSNETFMDIVLRVIPLVDPWQSWKRLAYRCNLCGCIINRTDIEAHARKHIDALVRNSPHHAAAWAAWRAGDRQLATELAAESKYIFKRQEPELKPF